MVLHHDGTSEQALGVVAWPTIDVIGDRTEARQVAVLAEVVKLRALAEIRERQAWPIRLTCRRLSRTSSRITATLLFGLLQRHGTCQPSSPPLMQSRSI